MKILVTNDDGIQSDALWLLVAELKKIAEVTVVAPDGERSAIGTAVTLVGSAVSGSFFPRAGLPQWVQKLSLITPNAWGIEIFSRLQLDRGLADVLPYLAGAFALTVVYYGLALLGFRRQFD